MLNKVLLSTSDMLCYRERGRPSRGLDLVEIGHPDFVSTGIVEWILEREPSAEIFVFSTRVNSEHPHDEFWKKIIPKERQSWRSKDEVPHVGFQSAICQETIARAVKFTRDVVGTPEPFLPSEARLIESLRDQKRFLDSPSVSWMRVLHEAAYETYAHGYHGALAEFRPR